MSKKINQETISLSNPKHTPENYVHHSLSSIVLVQKVKSICQRDDCIFDLGCSTGRILNQLYLDGFNNLYGCDINKVKPYMAENFPDLSEYFVRHPNRLFEGNVGDFNTLLPQLKRKKLINVNVDYFITHGRTIDVIAQYHGREAYEKVIDAIFSIPKKGVITIQNEWDRYYLDTSEKNQYHNCEIIIGEAMYAGYVKDRPLFTWPEKQHLRHLEKNLFYGYFQKNK